MSISPGLVRFDPDSMWVELEDGRTIGVPLAWFPGLFHASKEQREDLELSRRGIHWEALGEDISIEGLLMGAGDQTRGRPCAATDDVRESAAAE